MTVAFETTSGVGETQHEAVLPSGLRVIVVPKTGYRKRYALLRCGYGSIDNEFRSSLTRGRVRVPEGIAHFLEHKMFEKADGDVMDRFAALGCSTNAATSFNYTGYLIECTEHFDRSLELLVDFVTRPYFTEPLVEKEKGIIAEEIRMYDDDPSWRGFMGVLGNLYRTHPVATDIAGTVDSISDITADMLHTCHRTFYRPDNMTLAVAGDVDPASVARIAEGAVFAGGDERPTDVQSYFPRDGGRPRRRRGTVRMPIGTRKLHLGWKADTTGLSGVDVIALEIALEIHLGALLGKGGDLHRELFTEGLIDDTFHYSVEAEREYAFVMMGGDSPDPARLERVLCRRLAASAGKGLSSDDIGRLRRKMYGSYVRSFDSVESICWNVAECRAKDITYFDYGAMLDGLSERKIRSLARATFGADRWASHTLLPAA